MGGDESPVKSPPKKVTSSSGVLEPTGRNALASLLSQPSTGMAVKKSSRPLIAEIDSLSVNDSTTTEKSPVKEEVRKPKIQMIDEPIKPVPAAPAPAPTPSNAAKPPAVGKTGIPTAVVAPPPAPVDEGPSILELMMEEQRQAAKEKKVVEEQKQAVAAKKSFGGFKKGFFGGGGGKESTSTAKTSASSNSAKKADVIEVKAKPSSGPSSSSGGLTDATKKKDSKLIFDEVQQAMGQDNKTLNALKSQGKPMYLTVCMPISL